MKFKITATKTYIFYVFAETEEDAKDFVRGSECNAGAEWEDHKIASQTDLYVDVLDMSEDACWLDHSLNKVR